jgi:cytoplasmic iron level regulating protein YaaA (DUF328/UPF0246 family)
MIKGVPRGQQLKDFYKGHYNNLLIETTETNILLLVEKTTIVVQQQKTVTSVSVTYI